MSIIKWEPFSPRPFFLDWSGFLEDSGAIRPSEGLDIYETAKNIVVEAAVPGLSAEEIVVTVEDGVLTISGDHLETETDAKKKSAVYKSSRQTSFRYATALPREVDETKTKAKLTTGVIKITIPKTQEELRKPKLIAIETE